MIDKFKIIIIFPSSDISNYPLFKLSIKNYKNLLKNTTF